MNKKGNTFIFSIILIAMTLTILLFIIIIFMSEVNSLLYNVKLDMYSINKSAIISVNKGITSREKFSYDDEEYKKYFEKMLVANYSLDENLSNDDGIVQKVEILEYNIYQKGKKDNYTKLKVKDTTIHSVIKVKIKPIILENMLEKVFTFEIHEDVILNELKV